MEPDRSRTTGVDRQLKSVESPSKNLGGLIEDSALFASAAGSAPNRFAPGTVPIRTGHCQRSNRHQKAPTRGGARLGSTLSDSTRVVFLLEGKPQGKSAVCGVHSRAHEVTTTVSSIDHIGTSLIGALKGFQTHARPEFTETGK